MVPIVIVAVAAFALTVRPAPAAQVTYYAVPKGAHPHDVAPAPDGKVWYTAQSQGALGILDPKTVAPCRYHSGPMPRRTASSSAPIAPPGSPKAGRMPSRVSIRPPRR